MTERKQLENQIICLEQLQLTKWQAIWNKEFELLALDRIEKDAIEKAELGSNFQPEQLQKIKQKYDFDVQSRTYEISKYQLEISLLDAVLAKLNEDLKSLPPEKNLFEGDDFEETNLP